MKRAPRLVLASASATRASMLTDAGVVFDRCPAAIDERAVRDGSHRDGIGAEETALALARLKAARVAENQPKSLVLGADQILECDGRWLAKPVDRPGARDQLRMLRARSHRLATAAAMLRSGDEIWRHTATATLTMRDFSDDFIEHYLDSAGDSVTETVGAYRLEGLGAQLFERVEGDHFVILGLPLLALLPALRAHGLIVE